MKHYEDNFAHHNLPSSSLTFTQLPQFQHPEMLNCVNNLLDNHIDEGRATIHRYGCRLY